MSEHVTINTNTLESLLVYAFRYALGRQTYAVFDVGHSILKHRGVLHKDTKTLICKEIKEAVACGEAGAQCDVDMWVQVHAGLIDE